MIYILLSVRYSVTAFVATIGTTERDMGLSILNSRGPPITVEMFMSFSTFFYFKNVRKIKNVKKRFLHR